MKKEGEMQHEKALASYILGVLSIVFAFLSPVGGLLLGIVGLFIGKKEGSALQAKAKKLNMIGIVLSIVMFILSILLVLILKTQFPQYFNPLTP